MGLLKDILKPKIRKITGSSKSSGLSKTETSILRNIISYSDYNVEEVARTKKEIKAYESLKKKRLI